MRTILMRGVKDEIFGGPVLNRPTTVEGFAAEDTNIERALPTKDSHCHWHVRRLISKHRVLTSASAPATFLKLFPIASGRRTPNLHLDRRGCPRGGSTYAITPGLCGHMFPISTAHPRSNDLTTPVPDSLRPGNLTWRAADR